MIKLFCKAVQGELSGKGIMIVVQVPQGRVHVVDGGAFCFPSESSSISYWSLGENWLTVQFCGSPNTYYTYMNVSPSLLSSLMVAESVGSFIAKEVKGRYEFIKSENALVAV